VKTVEKSIPVGGTLGSIDQLVSQALSDSLNIPEGRLSGTSGEQVDGLVNPSQGGNIHSLPSDNSSRSDTCGIFTGTTAESTKHIIVLKLQEHKNPACLQSYSH
jgi:hypothetical protein